MSDAIKRRIVEHLACFSALAEVAARIADEFGVELTPRHIRAYDPTSFQFAGSRRWQGYFQIVRGRCVREVGQIAIAHRVYRLTQLQGILDDAMERGNFRQAAETLEQAAKEMGNWYVKA